jgi:hypothetical protein
MWALDKDGSRLAPEANKKELEQAPKSKQGQGQGQDRGVHFFFSFPFARGSRAAFSTGSVIETFWF